jgi:hypothetical protein
VERSQNVITVHGVEGSDKRFRETYISVIRAETDEVYSSQYRHTPTRQHDVIYGNLFPSPTATVSVNPSRVSLATATYAAFLARVFVICSVILSHTLPHHLLLCKVKNPDFPSQPPHAVSSPIHLDRSQTTSTVCVTASNAGAIYAHKFIYSITHNYTEYIRTTYA